MKTEFPWQHKRRFNAFTNYCVQKFGSRLQKVAVDAGFTCPNRDGTLSKEGCYYCNNNSFNPSYCHPDKSITEQITDGIKFLNVRYKRASSYLVYFQAYTNTYKPLEDLKKAYAEALSFPEVKGLIIGTRPDCLNNEILKYLSELSEKYHVVVELGMETTSNKTLELINRGHTFEQTKEALLMCQKYNVKAGIHLIFGLPLENNDDIIKQAAVISSMPVHSLKIHQLQIVKGTRMEKMFLENPKAFQKFTLNSYIELVISFTENLNPAIIIDRFAGEVPPRFLAGPSIMVDDTYGYLRNDQILQLIEKRMEEKDTWQGKYYQKYKSV